MSNNIGGGIVQVKTILSEEGNAVLHLLPVHYDYVVTDDGIGLAGEQCLTIRCSLNSVEQISSWLEAYQKKSYTRWIVGRCTVEPTRFTFRRQYFCHHSCINKGKTEKSKSTNCKAKIDLKIKKLTCDTRKKDEFLKLRPPLPTIIKLFYGHNHTTEYVVKREAFLAHFAATQQELQSEVLRLRGLISKNKPGLSAMRQFLAQLKNITTESQLFESMRKIRLKPTRFTRLGRPPKNKPAGLINPIIKKPPQKRLRTEQTISARTPTATFIALESGTVLTEEPIEFHTIEQETEQSTTAIDISFLINQLTKNAEVEN